MNHFYTTHFASYAILFNKDTYHSDVQVNSVNIHDTRSGKLQVVMESQSRWLLQAVISSESFRTIPHGKSFLTMMSVHINNQHAKKRGIGKNLMIAVRTVVFQEQVDMVAGDFHGAAWRWQSGNEQWYKTDQSCHHEVRIHLPHVDARLVDRTSRDGKYRQPSVRKRKLAVRPH